MGCILVLRHSQNQLVMNRINGWTNWNGTLLDEGLNQLRATANDARLDFLGCRVPQEKVELAIELT